MLQGRSAGRLGIGPVCARGESIIRSVTLLDWLRIESQPNLRELGDLSRLSRLSELVLIGVPEITSLAPFASLTGVRALVLEGMAGLTNLTGLDGVEAIGFDGHGKLTLRDNANLESLAALASAKKFDLGLTVSGHPRLANLTGLGGATQIQVLFIDNNPVLDDLSALAELVEVVGRIELDNNDSLVNLDDLGQLAIVGELLAIVGHDQLTSVQALHDVVVKGSSVIVSDNTCLASGDVKALANALVAGGFGGAFTIKNNGVGGDCSNEI